MRLSVDDGATRNTRSRCSVSLASSQAAASSGIRSGVIAPDPPACASDVAKRDTPYRSTGFQYVITTAAAPVAATAATASNASRSPTPARTAGSAAAWIVGPSITGSLYGTPTSIASQPPSTMARIAAIETGTDG